MSPHAWLTFARSRSFHDARVAGTGDPADEPCGGDVHDEAFEGEGNKAEIAGRRHLKDFVMLQNRENVVPLRRGPVIPEFPQPAANPSGNEQRIKTTPAAIREITEERR